MGSFQNVIRRLVPQYNVWTLLTQRGTTIRQDTISLIRGIPDTPKVRTSHYWKTYSLDGCQSRKSRGQDDQLNCL